VLDWLLSSEGIMCLSPLLAKEDAYTAGFRPDTVSMGDNESLLWLIVGLICLAPCLERQAAESPWPFIFRFVASCGAATSLSFFNTVTDFDISFSHL